MLIERRLKFAHVPKTGGTFVGRVLRAAGVELVGATGSHGHPSVRDDWHYFAFVRHPAPWLTSLWYHRKRWGFNWGPTELEKKCGASDFSTFIKKVCAHRGIVWRYAEGFLGPLLTLEDRLILGRTESLRPDLVRILDHHGVTYDKDVIYAADQFLGGNNKVLKHEGPFKTLGPAQLANLRETQSRYYDFFGY